MIDNFKQMIEDDIETIFLNEKEWANYHKIKFQNGNERNIKIIIDDDILQELKGKSPYDENIDRAEIFFFIKATEFSTAPAQGSFVWIDDIHFSILKTNIYGDGMYEIYCEIYQ